MEERNKWIYSSGKIDVCEMSREMFARLYLKKYQMKEYLSKLDVEYWWTEGRVGLVSKPRLTCAFLGNHKLQLCVFYFL